MLIGLRVLYEFQAVPKVQQHCYSRIAGKACGGTTGALASELRVHLLVAEGNRDRSNHNLYATKNGLTQYTTVLILIVETMKFGEARHDGTLNVSETTRYSSTTNRLELNCITFPCTRAQSTMRPRHFQVVTVQYMNAQHQASTP